MIDRLYRELRELSERAEQDPSLKDEVAQKLGRLRQLQAEEAAEMHERFRAWLPFEPGAGRAALEAATALLSEAALAQDWLRDQEEEAWRHLQEERSGGPQENPGPERTEA